MNYCNGDSASNIQVFFYKSQSIHQENEFLWCNTNGNSAQKKESYFKESRTMCEFIQNSSERRLFMTGKGEKDFTRVGYKKNIHAFRLGWNIYQSQVYLFSMQHIQQNQFQTIQFQSPHHTAKYIYISTTTKHCKRCLYIPFCLYLLLPAW